MATVHRTTEFFAGQRQIFDAPVGPRVFFDEPSPPALDWPDWTDDDRWELGPDPDEDRWESGPDPEELPYNEWDFAAARMAAQTFLEG